MKAFSEGERHTSPASGTSRARSQQPPLPEEGETERRRSPVHVERSGKEKDLERNYPGGDLQGRAGRSERFQNYCH
jgi:hypothetical protein